MRFYLFLTLVVIPSLIYSQVPQKMSYQAVIRNTDDELIKNSQVGIAISIMQNSPQGTEVFKERHVVMTNENGLVSLEIGNGNMLIGSIDLIDWASGPFYLKSETDPNGGADYVISGTSELLSVPYALYAVNSGNTSGGGDSDWVEDSPNNEVRASRNIALQVSGSQPFRVNVNAPAGIARLEAGSADGIGVQGNTNKGYGVRGSSGQGVGVHGLAGNFGDAILGEAANGAGVHGTSDGIAVLGESELNNAVEGHAKLGYGVFGKSEEAAAIRGESEMGDGIQGIAISKDRFGAYGFSELGTGVYGESESEDGIIGLTRGSQKVGVIGNGSQNSVGVRGLSDNLNGVEGKSKEKDGVDGRTEATVQEVFSLGPAGIGNGTGEHSGVNGFASNAYGGSFNSNSVSGVFARSSMSNGITARSDAGDESKAAVYGGASESAAGVLGWSVSGSGVKGKSDTGVAGEFEGEVHIENGEKKAKLKIDEMEDDKTAPVLVWSSDNYVRKREGWTIDESGTYFESKKGIQLVNDGDVVFRVNQDGTSYHKGLENFEGGLVVPFGDVQIRLLPNDGISVFSLSKNEYLFHANLKGDALAAESFFSKNINASTISAMEKNFKIDHPLDPEHKFLIHTSMESDERLNVYSGNITTDKEGRAIVKMPAWFEGLNTDFRYQLTVIGEFAQAIVKQEIKDGVFQIATNIPNVKVSWQVTGVRHDQWAKDNPTMVEIEK